MIKANPSTHSQGRVSSAELDILSSLGEQIKLDPELAKIASAEGEMPVDFQQALKEMSFEDAQALVDQLTQETAAAGAKQKQLNEQLANLLPENVSRLSSAEGSAELNPEAIVDAAKGARGNSQAELNALLGKGQAPKQDLALMQDQALKQRNAEDASRAFMPERKSIFTLPKNTSGAKNASLESPAAMGAGKNTQSIQNSQGLVDLNQFMSKQGVSGKQRALSAQYKNEQQSMLANKAFMEKQAPGLELGESFPDGSGLEDLGNKEGQAHELLQSAKLEASNLQSSDTSKVFNLSSLNKSNNMDAVISQIQDYVVQAQAAKEPSAQLTFNHPELGDIDILVKKGAGEQVHVTIGHQSQEAAKFFKQHQGDLLQTLQQSGVQVGEFKLESSASGNNGNQNNFDQNGKQNFANQQQNRSGNEQQRREDSHRREELWNLLSQERKLA